MKNIALKVVLVLFAALPMMAVAGIENPGFETGDTAGWTVDTNGQALPISVVSGETQTSAGTINPSLTDDFYAFTSQTGSGCRYATNSFLAADGGFAWLAWLARRVQVLMA